MKNMFYILGKSSTGKDTIYRRLLEDPDLAPLLQSLVPYTTRPKRDKEKNGREYFFKTNEQFREMEEKGLILEKRTYHTINGDWTYFTPMDNKFIRGGKDIITVGVIRQFISIRDKIKEKGFEINAVPIYIEVDEGERLIRAIRREQKKSNPCYDEICRRTLESDGPDFTEELLTQAQVNRFLNDDLDETVESIKKFILNINRKE